MSFKRSIVSLGFLAIALAAPAARAQTCKVNADCTKGFFCVLVPSAPPTEPTSPPACKAGTVCPVTDPAPTMTVATPVPTPDPTGYCQEASCATDADCGTGMLCHSQTYSACSGGTTGVCAPNTDCIAAKPADPVCTNTTVSTCVYKWQLPCNVDNDCGAGFTCQPSVSGSCSGSGGSPAAGQGTATSGNTSGGPAPSSGAAATAPLPPDTTCTTMTTFPGYCQPKATTCTVDTDCPTAWTCADALPTRTTNGTGVAVGAPASTGTGPSPSTGAADVAVPPAGTTTPALPAVTKMCASPLGGGYAVDASGTPTTTNAGSGGGTGSVIPPTVQNPGGTGMTQPTADKASAQPAAGCAVGGSSSGSPFALLLLGVVGLMIARRKR